MEEKELMEERKEEVEETEAEEKAPAEPQVGEPAPETEPREPQPNPEAETPAADGGSAPADAPVEPQAEEASPEPEPQPQEEVRTFTQEQVNELVGKARAEGRRKGYEQARLEARQRYGVDDDDQLDGLFADGSRYGELNERYIDSGNRLKEAQTELALVKSQILPERQGDVRAILSANGMEVTEENIASLLPTHPEWKAQAMPNAQQGATPAPAPEIPQPQAKAPAIDKLGVEPSPSKGEGDDERSKAMKLFGLSKK